MVKCTGACLIKDRHGEFFMMYKLLLPCTKSLSDRRFINSFMCMHSLTLYPYAWSSILVNQYIYMITHHNTNYSQQNYLYTQIIFNI